jgi:cytochrome c oxidase subunit II
VGPIARTRIGAGAAVSACALAFLSGCGDNRQSALDPHSSPARAIDRLWWGMLIAAVVVFAGVLLLIGLSIARRKREGMPVIGSEEAKLDRLVVVFGIVIPIVALSIVFYVANIGVVKATDSPLSGHPRMTVDVVGRQWFWEARYPGTNAVTANEIHIPVRTNVKVILTSPDVIHSFWVPELNKKTDVVPGHPNVLGLYADKVGVYRGQCAEFCGIQHAKMALAVYADPPARFKAWLANTAKPLSATAGHSPGFQAFTRNQCASCHTLRGTSARGRIGPDLTHLMTRKTLAALTIPNMRNYLGAWVVDPQQFKPGNRMPALRIPARDYAQIMSFLRSLK